MSNNSPVYWTANGLSLHTMAWSVKSFGGRRWVGGPKRGENLQVPFKRGQIYVPKSRQSQFYDINMWVLPVTVDGARDPSLTREQKAHENFRTIVAALDVEGQFELTKRWYEGSTVKSATALAEFLDGDGPSADDGTGFGFSLELGLADPYFYAPSVAIGTGAVTIAGEVPTDHVTLTFTGGTNPRLTTPDGNWIQYQGVNSGNVVIDIYEGLAMRGSSYVNGLIVRNPEFPEWLTLEPGDQSLTLSGGGSATIEYEAAYR